MSALHEIEKRLRREFHQSSESQDSKEFQQKLNKLFYDSILAVIKETERPKGKMNYTPQGGNKIPRKRNPFIN